MACVVEAKVNGVVMSNGKTRSEGEYRDTVGVRAYDLMTRKHFVVVRGSLDRTGLARDGDIKYLRCICGCRAGIHDVGACTKLF